MASPIQNWESRIRPAPQIPRPPYSFHGCAIGQYGQRGRSSRDVFSPCGVSEAIASLENALRVRLLDRSPRGIEPTIYARALLKRGDVVFDELKQGIRDIEFLADPTAGEVRIGCPRGFIGRRFLASSRRTIVRFDIPRSLCMWWRPNRVNRNSGNCESAASISCWGGFSSLWSAMMWPWNPCAMTRSSWWPAHGIIDGPAVAKWCLQN